MRSGLVEQRENVSPEFAAGRVAQGGGEIAGRLDHERHLLGLSLRVEISREGAS